MGSTGGRDGGDSLRGLTAAGPSKVGVDKAMRARDVSRPRSEADSVEPDDTEPDPARVKKQDKKQDHRRDGPQRPQSVGGSGSGGSSPDSS
jgi:hypothetical protein